MSIVFNHYNARIHFFLLPQPQNIAERISLLQFCKPSLKLNKTQMASFERKMCKTFAKPVVEFVIHDDIGLFN